eukprot:6649371-Pyramimonas_sp.AAC.1
MSISMSSKPIRSSLVGCPLLELTLLHSLKKPRSRLRALRARSPSKSERETFLMDRTIRAAASSPSVAWGSSEEGSTSG